jgi:hypothetical protein
MADYIDIPVHLQATSYSCGAACEEMIIQAATQTDDDQLDLYNESQSYKTDPCWHVDPDGLASVLNNHLSGAGNRFAPAANADGDTISRQICWAIHNNRVAPAAAINQGDHWVVVNGFDADREPTDPNDNGFQIVGIHVVDPFSSIETRGDPECIAPFASEGGHYSYAEWQSHFLPVSCGHWQGVTVGVCPAAVSPPPAQSLAERPASLFPGDSIVPNSAAKELAERSLIHHGLVRHHAWRASLESVHSHEPMLVQRLDRIDDYYHVVPIGRSPAEITAAVSIGARYGHYRQAARLAKKSKRSLPALTREEAYERIVHRRLNLPDGNGSLRVRPETLTSHRTLGWRPCLESLSPFLPFYMFSMGAVTIYVRIDGAVFTSLNTKRRGS